VALPVLAASLRAAGHEVELVDANVEACDRLLRPGALAALAARVERELARLDRLPSLDHEQQLAYSALWSARGDAAAAPAAIEEALATLRDASGARFYDPPRYEAAVVTVESALRLISAAHHPLELSFREYRTPFALLSLAAIEADAQPERDPFHGYFAELGERLCEAGLVGLVGISIVFPGQLQPAYSLAAALRRARPGLAIVAGGPALTQLLVGLDPGARADALGPFDAAVLFEGEDALVELARELERGQRPRGVIAGAEGRDLATLPPPDFAGLPLERYLSPEPVLPFDLSRGCYWGRCAFCHYGLTARGTACYRERPPAAARAQVAALARQHGCRLFYLSQDSVAPRTLLAFARAGHEVGGDPVRWSTDLRPERCWGEAECRELAAGGALSVSLGVESASPRLLRLIDKGITVDEMRGAIGNLARAGIAAELMCLTDFPTETRAEALATLGFVEALREQVSLFICGEFALTRGSRVAARPGEFGVRELWRVEGDQLGTGLFFEERRPAKSDDDRLEIDDAVGELARGWRLRPYPWAGALSTAHSMLWYARFGPGIFRELAGARPPRVPGAAWRTAAARFHVARVAERSVAREEELWSSLIYEERRVSPEAYRALAGALPRARPRPGRWRYLAGHEPEPARSRRERT